MNKESLILRVLEMLLNGEGKTEAKEIVKDSWDYTDHPMIGKYCVIRTYSAGVHIGTLKAVKGSEIILSDARRIFYWNGAFTLSELSVNGVSENSKLSIPVEEIKLTEIEILPCTTEQSKKLKEFKSHEC